ncbi:MULTISPECIES: hypothetical protein [Pseudomonas]|uniref:hypothetical protein n=1 Tax=Pseudomonas TaxID=286 RepID=UPI000761C044|nr:hypothetical protein [Pseudomonas monteilii]
MKLKNGLFGIVISAVAGCSLTNPYADLSPEKAASEIIKAASPQTDVQFYPPGLGIAATVFDKAARNDIAIDLERYCTSTRGYAIPYKAGNEALFTNSEGFVCHSKSQNLLTFAFSARGANLLVLERRFPGDASFDQTVFDWGYVSSEQRAQMIRQAQEKAARERQELLRLAMNKTKAVGDRVCQDQGSIRYQGTVEQIAGDKIKVFVESASVINAPGLRPGGFRQEYYWVNYWDVFACD